MKLFRSTGVLEDLYSSTVLHYTHTPHKTFIKLVGASQLIGKGVVINLAYYSVRCTVLLEYIVLYS
jgi:hypothetical protein